MASNDIRDVLNLPADGSGPRPSKKAKVTAARPNLKGLAREVQNLGGDTPIRIVPEASVYKKRRFPNRKPAAKWEHAPFKNSARGDQTLVLRHWKKADTAPGQANGDTAEGENAAGTAAEGGEAGNKQKEDEIEDSHFAKFNVKVDVPEYNEEQYFASLQSDEWTKDETDYLLQLVKDFDLRWPLIWDRYEYSPKKPDDVEMSGASTAVVAATKPRTMEDLKARYYRVAAVMMEADKPKPYMDTNEYALHQTMLNFNPDQERQRKQHAINIMNRTKEEAKEEESLLIEVKRIMARAEQTNQERLQLYERLDYTPVDAEKISQFQGSAGITNLVTHLQTQSQARKKKVLTGPDGVSPAGHGPHGQSNGAVSEIPPSRRESIAAQSAGGHRDSIGADKPAPGAAGNKKGQPPAERRVLSEYEKQIYGVSQHERLSSGPTYRYERVNKLFAHKSNSQQLRIQGVLNVLGIPPRLHIATATVVAEYEKLVANVTQVVEMRKHMDKLHGEIKIEEAKKAERAKARAVLGQNDGAADEPEEKKTAKAEPSPPPPAEVSGDKPAEKQKDSALKNDQPAPAAAAAAAAATPAAENSDTQTGEAAAQPNGGGTDAEAGEAADQPTPLVKQEEGTGRPGSSGGPSTRTKRSASVLSGTSDKSAKRQKK